MIILRSELYGSEKLKRRYHEDVQRYVNLNRNRISFKADVYYTGMLKGVTFPSDTKFAGDLIRFRVLGLAKSNMVS